MYVCVCKALTEKDVHSAVAEGCNSVKELKRRLGLGSECGRCASCAKGMLRSSETLNNTKHDGVSTISPL